MIFESNTKKINLEDLNTYELIYFNELLKYIFKDRIEFEEKTIKNKKYFLNYQINNLEKVEEIIEISDEFIKKCRLTLWFNCNTFKELLVKVELNNDKYNKIINLILNKMFNYLLNIKDKMKQNKYIENYFFECFQLSYGSFSNYYNFNYIELDFGEKQQSYIKPVVVKTKIKYKKILNDNFKNYGIAIDTLKIDRDICINLIQLFLRTNFELLTTGMYYGQHNDECIYKLNDSQKGKLIKCNRKSLIKFNDNEIADDIEMLFEYFNIIQYEEKSVFLQACEAYIEGLKSNNGKEIMFFVIALETLANYEFDDNQAKADKIYSLITKLYGNHIVTNDYINYIYEQRSLYSHQGISNNRIKQNIFNVLENNQNLIIEVEMLTYSSLIKWLIDKGEKYGR